MKPVRTTLTGCGDTLFLVTQVLAGILFLARLASLAARRTLKLASLAESSAAWQAVIFWHGLITIIHKPDEWHNLLRGTALSIRQAGTFDGVKPSRSAPNQVGTR